MAGVLEYALSLKTGGFNNPLAESESKVRKFEGAADSGSSALGGLGAAAAGAGTALAAFGAVTAGALAVLDGYAEFDGLVRGMKTLEGTAAATQERITLLRDVAKVPGLGFEEAVRGDIRLRAVGISAELSEKAMRAFGNAIATVGGGKADLDGVVLALGQMAAKGKVSAEEINQIAERVPQVRAALKSAFGTADTEELQKSGFGAMEVINRLVDELGELPKVTGGARNALDNYDDSWKELKNSASEFAVDMAGSWINTVSGAFNTATRDLQRLKNLFGVKTPGLQGADGTTEVQRQAEEQAAAQAEAARVASNAEIRAHNETVRFWEAKDAERAASEKANAALRVEQEKRSQAEVMAAVEKVFAARLTEEENLQRKINALKKTAPATPADVDKLPMGSDAKAKAAAAYAELITLQKQLTDLQANAAEKSERDAEAARNKAEAAAKELTAQQQAAALFSAENEILAARASGNDKLATQLERQAKVEQLKLELMRQQGLTAEEAAAAAEKRIALEERAAKPRRGLLDAAASAAARLERRSAADKAKGGDGLSNTDRLAIADLERRKARPLSPARAAEQLARGNAGADPGKGRRQEKEDAKQKQADPMLAEVKGIKIKLDTIASA